MIFVPRESGNRTPLIGAMKGAVPRLAGNTTPRIGPACLIFPTKIGLCTPRIGYLSRYILSHNLISKLSDQPNSVIAAQHNPLPKHSTGAHMSIADQAKQNWETDPGLKTEFNNSFDSYLAYMKADDQGLVRILQGTVASHQNPQEKDYV